MLHTPYLAALFYQSDDKNTNSLSRNSPIKNVNSLSCNTLIKRLKIAGIETAELDTSILLRHALGISSKEFLEDRSLTEEELHLFNSFIDRREKREPVSSITGVKEFWSIEFKTSTDTLDPRPDTETIIETILKLYPEPLRILDLGTGTGCILLSLLTEYPDATGVGVDISEEALSIAMENAKSIGIENRVDFIQSDWGENISGKFDIIVSNPPYIKTTDIQNLEFEIKYDPLTALDGGTDGLDHYRKLIPQAKNLLSGMLFLEIGENQEDDVALILEKAGFHVHSMEKDLAGIVRCIVAKTLSV